MCLWLHCIYRCIWKSQACFCKRSYFLTCWEETQLLLQLCLHTPTCWNAKTNANSSLWVVLFLSGLFSFAPFNLKKKMSTLFFSRALFIYSSLFLPLTQMLHNSISNTVRQPRTLRSCVRLVLNSSLWVRTKLRLLFPHLLLPAELFLPFPHNHIPSPSPTQALSLSKACISLNAPGVNVELLPHVCQSHSRPRCGEICRGSGTVLS